MSYMTTTAVKKKVSMIPANPQYDREIKLADKKLRVAAYCRVSIELEEQEGYMYQDIKESCEWKSVEKISKGWSSDEKYRIKTENDNMLLLRISTIENYKEKEKEFDIVSKFSTLNIPMSMPISFGKCNDGRNTYMLLSWVEGKDLEEV